MASLAGDGKSRPVNRPDGEPETTVSRVMACPYVFRAQAPPAMAKEAMATPTRPQVRETWPAGGGGGGGGWMGVGSGERVASAYDLVEQMHYLYVRVVRARGLTAAASTVAGGGGCNPYVEVRLGNYRGTTRHHERKAAPEWNQVFAFSRERVQASVLEVFVRGQGRRGGGGARRLRWKGRVRCRRGARARAAGQPARAAVVPPRGRRRRRRQGGAGRGHARGVGRHAGRRGRSRTRGTPARRRCAEAATAWRPCRARGPKVYVTPKLWYLRISVLEAQDVVPGAVAGAGGDKGRHGEAFVVVKVQVGGVTLRTKAVLPPDEPIVERGAGVRRGGAVRRAGGARHRGPGGAPGQGRDRQPRRAAAHPLREAPRPARRGRGHAHAVAVVQPGAVRAPAATLAGGARLRRPRAPPGVPRRRLPRHGRARHVRQRHAPHGEAAVAPAHRRARGRRPRRAGPPR
ncbi:hypothetical protein EE612_023902 [Oryza sativa]|nr:hypothetical protein EE612_023902 [Oryza sativa]